MYSRSKAGKLSRCDCQDHMIAVLLIFESRSFGCQVGVRRNLLGNVNEKQSRSGALREVSQVFILGQ